MMLLSVFNTAALHFHQRRGLPHQFFQGDPVHRVRHAIIAVVIRLVIPVEPLAPNSALFPAPRTSANVYAHPKQGATRCHFGCNSAHSKPHRRRKPLLRRGRAGSGNRTRMASLEDWNFTIKLYPLSDGSGRPVWRHRDADSRAILRGLRAGVRGEVHFCAGSIPVLRA